MLILSGFFEDDILWCFHYFPIISTATTQAAAHFATQSFTSGCCRCHEFRRLAKGYAFSCRVRFASKVASATSNAVCLVTPAIAKKVSTCVLITRRRNSHNNSARYVANVAIPRPADISDIFAYKYLTLKAAYYRRRPLLHIYISRYYRIYMLAPKSAHYWWILRAHDGLVYAHITFTFIIFHHCLLFIALFYAWLRAKARLSFDIHEPTFLLHYCQEDIYAIG